MRINIFLVAIIAIAIGCNKPAYVTPIPIASYKSGNVTFADSDFQYSISHFKGRGFIGRSSAAYVELTTNETSISIKIGGNAIAESKPLFRECEVLVNGQYNQSVMLVGNDTTEIHKIILPPGAKTIRLINGVTAGLSNTPSELVPEYGVYVQGVITDSAFGIIKPTVPDHKWLFVGNSITVGEYGTHPGATAFPALFRNDGRKLQVDGWSGRRLLTKTAALAHAQDSLFSTEMDGTVSNELFMFLGTNNFGGGKQSKALFKSEYQYFLDSLHAIRPDIKIYCVSPFNRGTYNVPNPQGATCEDFADAIRELLTTRVWAKFIYGKNLVSLSNLVDGLHPNQSGNQEIHDNLLKKYNSLQ